MPTTSSETLLATESVVIGNGQSLSSAIDLKQFALVGVQMPAAWTAANITFQASNDNVTFADLYDEASEVKLTSAAAGLFLSLDPAVFVGIRYLKIRSGVAATPVNQEASRTLVLIVKVL